MTSDDGRRATLRAIGDVSELGLRAAAAAVEQMLSLTRQLTEVRFPLVPLDGDGSGVTSNGHTNGDTGATNGDGGATGTVAPPAGPVDRQREMRRLRADAERLIELFGDWTRSLLDGATLLAEGDGATGAPDVLVLGPIAAGTAGHASAWLHVLDGPAAVPARVHATVLTGHDGSTIPPDRVTFAPATLDTTRPHTSTELGVVVAVPAGTPAGTYHGHLLADGLPEVHLSLRVEVI